MRNSDGPAVIVRPERRSDFEAIDRVQLAAFDDDRQIPPLIAAIRSSAGYFPELALVAVRRDDPDGIVGHVMISGTDVIDPAGRRVPILMLSPLGVAPAVQGRGVGSLLTRAALAIADTRDEPVTVVQGHPEYYPRFGFVRARTIGILPPEHLPDLDRAWMARRRPGSRPDVRGQVVYPPHFVELD